MIKRILFVTTVLVLAAITINACAAPQPTPTPPTTTQPAAAANTSTAAEGRLLPLQFANLNFTATGEVAEILVKEGDAVKAGAVIARLRNDTLKAAVAEAEAAVVVSKANQANYQASLPKQISAAQAQISGAQSQAASAAAGRNNAAAIKEAESQLAQLKYQLQQLNTALDMLYQFGRANGGRGRDVRQQIDSVQKSIDATEEQIAALTAGSPSDRAATAQISAASASEAAAQARLNQLQAEAAGKATDTFAAQIQQAEAALRSAQIALADTELKAPFDGTVATINIKVGEHPGASQPAVVLADLSGWTIETDDLTELKVPDVQVGQAVTVKVDALPDLTLKGQVDSIGDVSHLRSGDVVYPVKVKLVDNDPRLRWGMTVAVTFEK